MAASLESLRNDRIGPCLLGAERFRKRRGSGKPADTLCLEAFDKVRRKESRGRLAGPEPKD
jgi:hypothetical protein